MQLLTSFYGVIMHTIWKRGIGCNFILSRELKNLCPVDIYISSDITVQVRMCSSMYIDFPFVGRLVKILNCVEEFRSTIPTKPTNNV